MEYLWDIPFVKPWLGYPLRWYIYGTSYDMRYPLKWYICGTSQDIEYMWDICGISVGYSKNMYILDIFLVIIWEFRYISSHISEYWDIPLKTQPIFYRLSYRYTIPRDISYRGTSHRYIISRDIPAKAWQKGYPTNIPDPYLLKDMGSGPAITPL